MKKIPHSLPMFCIVAMTALSLHCSRQVAGGTETGHGVMVGTIFAAKGTSPASGAEVQIRRNLCLADTAQAIPQNIETVRTDVAGHFRFDYIDTGSYAIEASDNAGNKTLIRPVQMTKTDSITVVGPDTLKPTGAIKGAIFLSEGSDPRKVLILSFGMDKMARVNADGSFLFSDLAPGTYTLRFLPLLSSYDVKDTESISVESSDTTDIGTVALSFNGIPLVKGLAVSPDFLKQIVVIRWNKSPLQQINGYAVYRRTADSNTVFTKINTAFVTDTVYVDSTCSPDGKYEYTVAVAGSNSQIGAQCAPVAITVKSNLQTVKTLDASQYAATTAKAVPLANGNFYILGRAPTPAVFLTDSNATVLDTIGKSALNKPSDAVIDDSGNVYVADGASNTGFKFSPAGTLIGQWPTKEFAQFIALQDTLIFVAGNSQIESFSANGNSISVLGTNGDPVKGLAADQKSGLFVYTSRSISLFVNGVQIKSIFNADISNLAQYSDNGSMVIDNAGNLLFILNEILYKIDTAGTLLFRHTLSPLVNNIAIRKSDQAIILTQSNGIVAICRQLTP